MPIAGGGWQITDMALRAVVIGAGIGGLASAAGLHRDGWDVTVCERAAELAPIGAGIAVAPNGLRALDTIEAGQAVRALATHQELGVRRSDGRRLVQSSAAAIAARFGDPVVLLARGALLDALLAAVPAGALQLSAPVTAVVPGDQHSRARVSTAAGDLDADLVVAADGIHSVARAMMFPDHPGLRYAGFTTWRFLADPIDRPGPMTESWGRGAVFGVMPLADGRVYGYAAAPAAAGVRAQDEIAELTARFGDWHDPIPRLLRATTAEQVLHLDVEELIRPLPAFHLGRVALVGDAAHPMTPNLGQGGCQALEDATVLARLAAGAAADRLPDLLASYTSVRLPRATDVVRRSRRVAALATMTSPFAVAARDATTLAVGRLMPDAALRSLAPVYDWRPPPG